MQGLKRSMGCNNILEAISTDAPRGPSRCRFTYKLQTLHQDMGRLQIPELMDLPSGLET